MDWLVPIAAFTGTALLTVLLAWWSGAWRSMLRGAGDDRTADGRDPEMLLRAADAHWIENHDFWKTSEIEEIAL